MAVPLGEFFKILKIRSVFPNVLRTEFASACPSILLRVSVTSRAWKRKLGKGPGLGLWQATLYSVTFRRDERKTSSEAVLQVIKVH